MLKWSDHVVRFDIKEKPKERRVEKDKSQTGNVNSVKYVKTNSTRYLAPYGKNSD